MFFYNSKIETMHFTEDFEEKLTLFIFYLKLYLYQKLMIFCDFYEDGHM